jgi:hypothetical protein
MLRWLSGRFRAPRWARRTLRFIMAFERLERWPTRYRTGYFVAIRAIKRRPHP